MPTLLEAAQNIASFIERKDPQIQTDENITRSELKAEEKELGKLLADLDKALFTNTNVAAILAAREVIGKSANTIIEAINNK